MPIFNSKNKSITEAEEREIIGRLKLLQKVELSKKEKSILRQELLNQTTNNWAAYSTPPIIGRTASWDFFNFGIKRWAAASLAVVIFMGGGITWAAEKALPGDKLYKVKTGLNDGVRELLAVTPESKAEVFAELTKRTLIETENLVATNKLSAKAQVAAVENFEKNAEKTRHYLTELYQKGETAKTATFHLELSDELAAHRNFLNLIAKVQLNNNQNVAQVAEKVSDNVAVFETYPIKEETPNTVSAPEPKLKLEKPVNQEDDQALGSKNSKSLTATVSASPSPSASPILQTPATAINEARKEKIRSNIESVKKYIEENEPYLDKEFTQLLKNGVEISSRSMSEGEVASQKKNQEMAEKKYKEANRLIHEIKIRATAAKEYNIEIESDSDSAKEKLDPEE